MLQSTGVTGKPIDLIVRNLVIKTGIVRKSDE